MIEATNRFFTLHSILGGSPNITQAIKTLAARVGMLFVHVIQVALFHNFHNVAVLGFCIGFIFDASVQQIAKKVDDVYRSCRTLREKISLFAIGVGSLYTMPVSILVVTLYQSAQWGSYIYQSSIERLRRHEFGQAITI